jgi:hypothetical protein
MSYRMGRPHDLLRWFMDGYRAEMPERMTSRGVWSANGEGSRLGSPPLSGDLRALTEDDPRDAVEHARLTDDETTKEEEAYRFPMRTALKELAGKAPTGSAYWFMGEVLRLTARLDGNWDKACEVYGIIEPVRRAYITACLERLYDRYQAEPSPRVLPRVVRSSTEVHSSGKT